MLKNRKESTTTKGSGNPPASGHSHNSLVQGTLIEGTLRSENDIRIDGTFKGNLHCKSKVIVGPTGQIEGDVHCKDAVVEGKFDGNLEVSELLNIRKTAKVTGEVIYGKLIVEGGSVFNVSCSMGRPEKRTAAQKSAETGSKSKPESDLARQATQKA